MKPQKNQKNKPNLFGTHAVREAFLNPARTIHALYTTPQNTELTDTLTQQARKAGLKRPQATIIDKDQFERMLPRGAVHQGIALSCAPINEQDLQDFIISAENRDKTVLCILDQVTDPHNVGAILRSASAFGINGIIMQKKHAPTLDGVLAKTACGAADHINVTSVTNLARAIEELQKNGFYVYGFDEHSAQSVTQIVEDLPKKTVLILGSEGDGMRRLLKEKCDILVKLPTQGAIASLNVSNAAAVGFYAFTQEK